MPSANDHLPSDPALQISHLFGLDIRACTFDQATAHLLKVASQRNHTSRIVVTPNVDHVVKLDSDPIFKAQYAEADYIFADGMPIIWASKMVATPLPERVTGADLFVSLCQGAIQRQLSIFVIGGQPGQEAALLASFAQTYPGLNVSIFCPSMQFSADGEEGAEAMRLVQQAQPNIVFVCLGMPKQERWCLRYRKEFTENNAPLLLCVGAAMEFALGQKKRAPLWMQKIGMEWFWRLASEPRRLWQRYTTQGMKFIGVLQRERQSQRAKRHSK
ncbi:WecB/TagA/CpsF family glycosyltransferase [Undibacterium sp. RuTC16W]|uniref:WecB/TagA/CpsF family glycosyltransferase n=1 Tax=Undibacterium sp. RuTC16W TaxID=3413048 RepID=UPI003BF04DF5